MTRPTIPLDVHRLAYSLEEASSALSVSPTMLQRAISHGLIKSIKVGAAIRLPVAEIERVGRDGLPAMPRGYKRKTDGGGKRGRKSKKRPG